MIRTATPNDRDAVKKLWLSGFPADPTFADYYFSILYPPLGQTLLDDEDGTLTAMLRRLPRTLRSGEANHPVTYIYGACTAPAYRNQGRMTRLLKASFEYDVAEGKAASITIPETPELFSFYAGIGYCTNFFTEKITLTRTHFFPYADTRFKRLSIVHVAQLNRLYTACTATFDPVCERSEADWREQIAFFGTLGSGVYGLFKGEELVAAAFIWPGGDVQECIALTPELRDRIAQHLMASLDLNEITLTGPGGTNPIACLRAHGSSTFGANGYLNLLFN